MSETMPDPTPMPTPIARVAEIARVCHEANRAYCETLGDSSQAPWADSPQWQCDSAFDGVRKHIEAGPDWLDHRASHEAWLELKSAEGWVYGRVKDADAKTHPCFVPYDHLPADQRRKDVLFGAIVKALR